MRIQRRGSIRIPAWVLQEAAITYNLSPAETLVLITFASHLRDGVTFVTDSLMHEYTNLSRPTIQRARPKLVKLGLLVLVSPSGQGRVARYTLPDEMPIPAMEQNPATRRADHDGQGWIASPEDI